MTASDPMAANPDSALVECVALAIAGAPHWFNSDSGITKEQHRIEAARVIAALRESGRLVEWRPIETAPKDGTYVILGAPSGYITTPLRAHVGHYDAEYRPLDPWQTHSDDSFCNDGEPPTCWMALPATAEKEGE